MLKFLFANDENICYNILAAKICAFKSGGVINKLLLPHNTDELIKIARETDKYAVIGNCTNTLIGDEGVRAPLICTKRMQNMRPLGGLRVYAESGVPLSMLIRRLSDYSLSGLEKLFGIPGTLGGAITMNAGCFGSEIADAINYVDVLTDGKIERIYAKNADFGYRKSVFKGLEKAIITGAELRLAEGDKRTIDNTINKVGELRKAKQPGKPSLGSVFRAANGVPAGKIIEKCGLKGLRIGGAEVSFKHANFIVNESGAASADFMCLADKIKSEVLKKTGVKLRREVIYLDKSGRFDIE